MLWVCKQTAKNPWDVILRCHSACQNQPVSRVEGRGSGASRGPGSRLLEDYHSFLLVPTAQKKKLGLRTRPRVLASSNILSDPSIAETKKISQMTAIANSLPVCVQTIYN